MVGSTYNHPAFKVGDAKDIDLNGRFIHGPEQPHLVKKVASANVRNSHDDEVEVSIEFPVWTKSKTITLINGLKGTQRFIFDMRGSVPGDYRGQIWRNGVAVGSEQITALDTYTTYTEDLTLDWNPGDTVELWARGGGFGNNYFRNFRLAYDDSPTVAVDSSNS